MYNNLNRRNRNCVALQFFMFIILQKKCVAVCMNFSSRCLKAQYITMEKIARFHAVVSLRWNLVFQHIVNKLNKYLWGVIFCVVTERSHATSSIFFWASSFCKQLRFMDCWSICFSCSAGFLDVIKHVMIIVFKPYVYGKHGYLSYLANFWKHKYSSYIAILVSA